MQVFSYWDGPITWMERLSVASCLATGHDLTVYSHNPAALSHDGLGCKIGDAGEIMFEPTLEPMRRDFPAHWADHFRIEGLGKALGTWVDLDLIFLKPLPGNEYIMGWESDDSICNAVLRLPMGPRLAEYRAICRRRPAAFNMPWMPLKKRLKRQMKRVTRTLQGRLPPAPLLGPTTLTHLVHKHGVAREARAMPVFYPVPISRDNIRRFGEPGFIESFIRPETVAVHLWSNVYRRVYDMAMPPADGWLHYLHAMHIESRGKTEHRILIPCG